LEDIVSTPIDDSVLACFRDLDFPADRDDLIRAARHADLSPQIMDALRRLPVKGFSGRYQLQQALSDCLMASETVG
jgi:uncharacterized protein DUF2795